MKQMKVKRGTARRIRRNKVRADWLEVMAGAVEQISLARFMQKKVKGV